MKQIAQNRHRLLERIAEAAQRAGRDPRQVEVVAVTKTRSAAEIDAAIGAGFAHVGENRIQEAEAKKSAVAAAATWHFVGHLQTNKAARAVELFDVVQSVDRPRLANALDERAAAAGRTLDILLQVNTSGAAQQHGVDPDGVRALAEAAALPNLRVCGLMTIGEFSDDESAVRGCFSRLRKLGEELSDRDGVDMRYLSMGMSGDFEWAIAEGANMVRLGTAIFGERLQVV